MIEPTTKKNSDLYTSALSEGWVVGRKTNKANTTKPAPVIEARGAAKPNPQPLDDGWDPKKP